MHFDAKLEGAKELDAMLRGLDKKVAKKVTRKSLREGGKVILPVARAMAPIKGGATRKAVKVKAGKSRKDYLSVLVAVGAKWFTGKTFYAAFVNFGHFMGHKLRGKFFGAAGKARYAALSFAAGRKHVPGQHWVEAAFDATKDAAAKKIVMSMKTGIEAVAQEKA